MEIKHECLYKENKNCKYALSYDLFAVRIPKDIYITGTCRDCDWYGDGIRLEKFKLD